MPNHSPGQQPAYNEHSASSFPKGDFFLVVVEWGAGRVDTPQTITAKFVSAPHPAYSSIQVVFLKKICPLSIYILYRFTHKHFT